MKSSVLTRYRVMAYVTGVLLVALTLGVIGKYVLDISGAGTYTTVVGIVHGWLYLVYLIFAFDMCSKAKWPIGRMAWVLLAGTVPTAAFFVERRVTRELGPKVIRGGDTTAPANA
jgi:integral membrane protein